MSWGIKALLKRALELPAGEEFVAVAPPGRMRLIYNETTGQAELSISGGAFTPIGVGGASPWIDAGGVVRLSDITDQVVIGAVMPVGAEKVRIVGDLLVNSTVFVNALSTPVGGGSDLTVSSDSGVVAVEIGSVTDGFVITELATTWFSVDPSTGSVKEGATNATVEVRENVGVTMTIPDNGPNAMVVFEGVNEYLRVDTTNAAEQITLGDALPASTTWSGTGQTTEVPDNAPNALVVLEGANEYLRVDTTDASEQITVGDALPASTTWSGGGIDMEIPPAAPVAYNVHDNVGTDYITVDTTVGAEQIIIGNAVTNPEVLIEGSGGMCSPVVCLEEQGADPAAEANRGKVYAKDVATVTELFYRDSGGSVVQITSGGFVVGGVDVSITDNTATAYRIHETANNYLLINTSNGAESMRFGNAVTNPGYVFLGTGELSLDSSTLAMTERAGNPANAPNVGKLYTKDVATITELFYIDSAGSVVQITSAGSVVGGTDVVLADNSATAYRAHEGANNYVLINTTNATENISFGNATTNPSYSFLGSGDMTIGSGLAVGGVSAAQVTLTVQDNIAQAFRVQEGANEYIRIDTTNAAEKLALIMRTGAAVAFQIALGSIDSGRAMAINTSAAPFGILYGGDAGGDGAYTHNFRVIEGNSVAFRVGSASADYILVSTVGAGVITIGSAAVNNTVIFSTGSSITLGSAAGAGAVLDFPNRAADPGTVADTIRMYCKLIGGVANLFTEDDTGAVVAHTRGGFAVANQLESTAGTLRIFADATGIGFFGTTPVSQRGPYTVAGATPDRSYDVATVTLTELANVVAAILQDLGDVAGSGLFNTDI